MKKVGIIVLAIIGILILFLAITVGWIISTNNRFARLDEEINLKAGDVQVLLQQRNDKIPNLVNTVKGYLAHEQQLFTEIANARNLLANAMENKDTAAIAEADAALTSSLKSLISVIVEDYPELKSDAQVTALMDEIAGSENRIGYARQKYNLAVSTYNKMVRSFPSSIIANANGYTVKPYFEADETAQQAPKVEF